MPGAAIRSIAAEDYRLTRDRRASFGRRIEGAFDRLIDASMNAQLRKMRLYKPGDRLTSPKASNFGGQRSVRQRGQRPEFRASPTASQDPCEASSLNAPV
jgi:hypothetical protein